MIEERLFELRDEKYKDFVVPLIPTVDKETVIGVRIPDLRVLAREISGSAEEQTFMCVLPHKYYEEDNLHVILISMIRDFDRCISATESFLPYIDNWATCDSLRPKVFSKNTDKLLPYVRKWLGSDHIYTVRFGIECLMTYYLGDAFSLDQHRWVADVQGGEYYVDMMIAWYFATALAKRWDETVAYIENGILPEWIHNKAISKSSDSYRITKQQKEYLKTLRRKRNTL